MVLNKNESEMGIELIKNLMGLMHLLCPSILNSKEHGDPLSVKFIS